jgi:hypothetical protein
MPGVKGPDDRTDAEPVSADWSRYDLAAEEREKRRQFFVGLPILAVSAVAIGILVTPVIGRHYALPVMHAAIAFAAILVSGLLSVWERLTLRLGVRLLGAALIVAFLVGSVSLLLHELGFPSRGAESGYYDRPQN